MIGGMTMAGVELEDAIGNMDGSLNVCICSDPLRARVKN